MLDFTIKSIKNVDPGTPVISEEVEVVTTNTDINVFVDNGEIIKNGTSVGTSTTANHGDKIRISLISSFDSGRAIHSKLTIENKSASFTVITKILEEIVQETLDYHPLQRTFYLDGEPFVPDSSNNKITIINALTGEKKEVKPVADNYDENSFTENSFVFITNYFNNTIFRINTEGVVQSIPVGNKPYEISYITHPETELSLIHLTNTEDGTVSRLNSINNYQIDKTILVGNNPLGIAGYDTTLWVANYSDNTVSRLDWDYISDNYTETVISVGNNPVSVIIDENKNAWVVNSGDNTVSRINFETNEVDITTEVGTNPWFITYLSGYLWVSNSASGTVSKLDMFGNKITDIEVGRSPFSMLGYENFIFVADYEDYTITAININTNEIDYIIPVDPVPLGISEYLNENEILTSNYYSNLPTRFAIPIYKPAIEIVGRENIPLSTETFSNISLISNIETRIWASIPPNDYEAVIIKNGEIVGLETHLENGDTLQIKSLSGGKYKETISIPVFVADDEYSFNVTTIDVPFIDGFYFEPIVNAGLNQEFLSNEIVISGLPNDLPEDYELTLTYYSSGNRIKYNGTDVFDESISIKNGDTIAIYNQSSENNCETTHTYVDINGYKAAFAVTTINSEDVILPELMEFDFSHTRDAKLGEFIYSNIIEINFVQPVGELEEPIENEEEPVYISISIPENYFNAVLIKNGEEIGSIITVTTGDTVQVKMQTLPIYLHDHYVPVSVCGYSVLWQITTIPRLAVDPFYFNPIYDQLVRQEVTSNTIIVSGLPEDYSVKAWLNEGKLIINGIETNYAESGSGGISVDVKNGDVIAISVITKSPYGTEYSYILSILDELGIFKVKTVELIGPLLKEIYPDYYFGLNFIYENIYSSLHKEFPLNRFVNDLVYTKFMNYDLSGAARQPNFPITPDLSDYSIGIKADYQYIDLPDVVFAPLNKTNYWNPLFSVDIKRIIKTKEKPSFTVNIEPRRLNHDLSDFKFTKTAIIYEFEGMPVILRNDKLITQERNYNYIKNLDKIQFVHDLSKFVYHTFYDKLHDLSKFVFGTRDKKYRFDSNAVPFPGIEFNTWNPDVIMNITKKLNTWDIGNPAFIKRHLITHDLFRFNRLFKRVMNYKMPDVQPRPSIKQFKIKTNYDKRKQKFLTKQRYDFTSIVKKINKINTEKPIRQFSLPVKKIKVDYMDYRLNLSLSNQFPFMRIDHPIYNQEYLPEKMGYFESKEEALAACSAEGHDKCMAWEIIPGYWVWAFAPQPNTCSPVVLQQGHKAYIKGG